jgi:hypothetical protein
MDSKGKIEYPMSAMAKKRPGATAAGGKKSRGDVSSLQVPKPTLTAWSRFCDDHALVSVKVVARLLDWFRQASPAFQQGLVSGKTGSRWSREFANELIKLAKEFEKMATEEEIPVGGIMPERKD